MRVTVQKWGNSLALRIPHAFAKEAKVTEGVEVDLSIKEGRLVAEPLKTTPTLEELLERVTDENRPEVADFGPPVGRETW